MAHHPAGLAMAKLYGPSHLAVQSGCTPSPCGWQHHQSDNSRSRRDIIRHVMLNCNFCLWKNNSEKLIDMIFRGRHCSPLQFTIFFSLRTMIYQSEIVMKSAHESVGKVLPVAVIFSYVLFLTLFLYSVSKVSVCLVSATPHGVVWNFLEFITSHLCPWSSVAAPCGDWAGRMPLTRPVWLAPTLSYQVLQHVHSAYWD